MVISSVISRLGRARQRTAAGMLDPAERQHLHRRHHAQRRHPVPRQRRRRAGPPTGALTVNRQHTRHVRYRTPARRWGDCRAPAATISAGRQGADHQQRTPTPRWPTLLIDGGLGGGTPAARWSRPARGNVDAHGRNNLYSGGTTVTGGLINFNSANNFGSGPITLARRRPAMGERAPPPTSLRRLVPVGAGGGTFDTNGNTVTFATGPHRQRWAGQAGQRRSLIFTGNNTYTGGTAVLAGTLAVNGSVAGNVAVGAAGTLGGNGTIGGNVVNARHPGARQLDRHAQHQRQLHPGRRQHLPGRGQCRRPGRPHQCRRRGGDPGRHGAGAGAARQLRQQHDLHHPARHRRRQRHLRRRHQQLRLPDADAELRRQRRVPHPVATPAAFTPSFPGAGRPTRGRMSASPSTRASPRPAATSPWCWA